MPLANPKAFFDRARNADLLGPILTSDEVSGCEAILAAVKAWPLSHAAYALATSYLETAGTMQPIREMGGPEYLRRQYDVAGRDPERAREHGNVRPGDGVRYCGRGYVQMTWQVNYLRAQIKLGLPLVDNPDMAMRPDVAAKILEAGMREGWFTGRRLLSFLPPSGAATRPQFVDARAIINGNDRAGKIADVAMDFQEALMAGGWS